MKIKVNTNLHSGLNFYYSALLTLLFTLYKNDMLPQGEELRRFLFNKGIMIEELEFLEVKRFIRILEGLKVIMNDKSLRLFEGEEVEVSDILPFDRFVEEYRNIFPTGKKGGSWYWRSNRSDLTDKMKKFMKKHKSYTQEQILQATRRYVNSFNDLTRDMGMVLSKNFLLKNNESLILDYMSEEAEEPTIRASTRI